MLGLGENIPAGYEEAYRSSMDHAVMMPKCSKSGKRKRRKARKVRGEKIEVKSSVAGRTSVDRRTKERRSFNHKIRGEKSGEV